MNKVFKLSLVVLISCCFQVISFADSTKDIKLPEPQKDGGIPLMKALSLRKSARTFSDKKLSPQVISNLLWAAFGINREDGKRTAPSARNWQDVDIYVAMDSGLYLYDAKSNTLLLKLSKDIREVVGVQDFTQTAPVCLIYVSDFSKMQGKDSDKVFYSATDTGFISQNVYLFCASEKLNTVVLGWVNKPELRKAMKLSKDKHIILTQPVGYPL
jgi:SagB-type dehydrogenase family enzyme